MKNNRKNLFGRTRGLFSNAAKSISPNAVTNKRSFTAGQTGTTQQYASPNAVTNKRTFTTGQSGSTAKTGKTTDYTSGKAASPNAVTNKRTFAAAGQGTSNQKQQSFDELYSTIQNQPTLPDREVNRGANASAPNAVTNKRSFTVLPTVGTVAPKPTQQEPVFNSITAGFGVNGIGAQNAALQGNSTPAGTKIETEWSAPGGLGSRTYPFTADITNNNSHASFAAQTRQKLAGEDQREMFRPEEGIARYRKKVAIGEEIKYSEPICLVANVEGPVHDPNEPTVKAQEDILGDVDKEITNLASQMLHDPDPEKYQEKMEFLKGVRQGGEANIAGMPYILPEEVFENPYMANFADLLCLRVVGEEDEKSIRKALEYLYTAMDTHYSKGEYTMYAAAIDCAAVLERKLPKYAFALGVMNEKTYHIPELVTALQFYSLKGDAAQQTLSYMTSEAAVQKANPKAYAAGKYTVKAYDFLKGGYDLASSGALNLNDVFEMSGKEVLAVAPKYLKNAAPFFIGSGIDSGVQKLAEHLYETGMSE